MIGAGFSIIESFSQFANLGAEWVMWLLMLLGGIMVALILERVLFFNKRSVNAALLAKQLIEELKNGRLSEAKKLVDGGRSMEEIVVYDALASFGDGPTVIDQEIKSSIAVQKQDYDQWLNYFGTLGNNAPFIGLFGTVIGIIISFEALGNNPKGGLEVVGPGIAEALVATAVGLMVAIPAVVVFNVCKTRVKKSVSNASYLGSIILAWAERGEG